MDTNYDSWKTKEKIDIPKPREREEPEYEHGRMSILMISLSCQKEFNEKDIQGKYDNN